MAEPETLSKIIAVIFDMDGVLIDSEPIHQAATDEVAQRYGLPPVTQEIFVTYFYGRTDYSGFLDYLSAVDRTDLSIQELIEANTETYAQRFPNEVQPFGDAIHCLRQAAERGYRLAIVSGGRNSEIAAVVERFELTPLLNITVGGDDVPVGKPDPAPYLTGAMRLGLEPRQCLAIEDTAAGVSSALAAGMRCLAVDRTGQSELLAAADRVVTTLTIASIEALAKGAK